ncbi:FG-GAP repeat domain-containing protein [Streptomyces sp. NPDC056194]|uniref:FG-GAP repeat domain-containing protein n=1 Tax=unclassified Streptomyces TaxID=2593676 RepID=UPI0035DED84D
MHHTHHRRRLRRLAACTTFALGMGLVSAGQVPTAAAAPAAVSATASAKPRFDRDGDGRSDRIYRSAATGKLTIILSKTGGTPFTIGADDLDGAVSEEILPADDVWRADGIQELLTLRSDGTLRLHAGVSPTETDRGLVWQGGGWQIYNKVIAPGDLTKDGRQDLLARTQSGTLYLFPGKGSVDYRGPFASRVAIGGGWQIYDQIVGTNDLDGDAVADIVARTPAGDLYFYKGTGSATAPFKSRVRIGGGWNTYNQVIGVDDLNGDGRGDLLARTYSGTYYQYLSIGGGKFGARTYFGGGGQNLSYYLGQGGVPAYGKHNLFAVNWAGTAYTYGTQADGRFGPAKPYGLAGENAHHGRMTNGYGLDEADRAMVLTANNPGLMSDRGGEVSTSAAFYNYTETVSPGDVTFDGEGDVLGLDPWGNLFLHPGLKDYPQRVGAGVKVATGLRGVDQLVATGDVTGDGRPDLVSREGDRLYVHRGTGSATAPFAARALIGAGWSAYEHLAAPGDMDGDGRADLIAVTPGGDVYRYKATGLPGGPVFATRVKIAGGWLYVHLS